MKGKRLFLLVLGTLGALCGALFGVQSAHAAVATSYPNGDYFAAWNTFGTKDGPCGGDHCGRLDLRPVSTSSGIETTTALLPGNASRTDEFQMTDVGVGQGATQIKVFTYVRAASGIPILDAMDSLHVQLNIGGQYITGTNSEITPTTSWVWYETTFTGNWTQSQVNGMRVRLQNEVKGLVNLLQNNIQVAGMHAEVTYTENPHLNQSAVRTYHPSATLNPGNPLADTNTAADLHGHSVPFRVRMGITPTLVNKPASHKNYKLQYATRNDTNCAASSTYTDVGTAGALRWYDHPSLTDGATISAYAHDPVTAGPKVHQTYRESAPFTNPVATPANSTALWDFSLQTVTPTPGNVFCLRIVETNGATLNSYDAYATVRAVGSLSAAIVDGTGQLITQPNIAFSPLYMLHQCQTATGLLGEATKRLRITNDIATNGWSASIAPTQGSGATWQSGVGQYDFNNPAGSPTGCAAGQLSLAPQASVITPQSGCSATGINRGANASFSAGTTEVVTLLTASAATPRFCYWDVTNIGLSQQIPAYQPPGDYSLDMTITVVAQ